jgi:hypothetical protein
VLRADAKCASRSASPSMGSAPSRGSTDGPARTDRRVVDQGAPVLAAAEYTTCNAAVGGDYTRVAFDSSRATSLCCWSRPDQVSGVGHHTTSTSRLICAGANGSPFRVT